MTEILPETQIPEIDKAIDYEDLPVLYGHYEHTQVSMQEALNSFTASGGQTMTFQLLGMSCVNLSKSFIQGVLGIPATANRYPWIYANPAFFMRQLNFQPQSGNQLSIDQVMHYSKMSAPYLTSLSELKNMSNENMLFPCRELKSVNKQPATGFNGSVDYEEQQYAIQPSKGSIGTDCQYQFSIPLSAFKGTIFAENRDFWFGSDVNLQIIVEQVTNWIWTSLSPTDPNSTPLAITTNCTLNNVYLQLACEKDEMVVKRCREMYENGYQVMVPNVQLLYKQQQTGSAQSISTAQLTRGFGEKLQRIFISPFASTETANTFLDNSNARASPITDVQANRVVSFQSVYDMNPRQQKFIYASPQIQGAPSASVNLNTYGLADDFNRYKDYFDGSCILNSSVLGYNWVFVEDFTSNNSRLKKSLDDDHKIEGTSLLDGTHTFQFNTNQGTTWGTSAINWYVFVQTWKKMTVRPGEIMIY